MRPVRRLRAEAICAVLEYAKWHGGISLLDVVSKAENELELMNKVIYNTKATNEKLRDRINRMYSENSREK